MSFARGEVREVGVPGAGDLWGEIYGVGEEDDARGFDGVGGDCVGGGGRICRCGEVRKVGKSGVGVVCSVFGGEG